MNDCDRVINRYQGLKSGMPAAPESTVDKLYKELEMRRRELEDVQRQLLVEKRKVQEFVGHDVQMLTVRPVDMTQMNANPIQALPSQPWNPQLQMQQMQQQGAAPAEAQQMAGAEDTLSISAPVLMNTAAEMSAQREQEEGAAQAEEWHGEEQPAKRTKLDVAAEAVASMQ
eukprot:TRINITY_DN2581_c0_g1_i8.p1 TRINITY_DN2581_c0_g1~~TRINITY_DN2581_c0_g1_i8.p1  ORF type:complete len:171 (-),score=70.50 TRINITY_DN2581_c0_g1_i8:305-817(-)